MNRARQLLALGLFSLSVPLLTAAGCDNDNDPPPPDPGCSVDADCAEGRHCADNGDCVECTEAAHCGEGELCCRGACLADGEQEDSCGCGLQPGGATGTTCDALELCVAGGERVSGDNLAEGTCACTCDPSQGGTLCTVDEQAALGFSCSCDRTDLATCERPALDDYGSPHVVADTCNPSEACVCFGSSNACDPDGQNPDCTINGCENLYGNDASCGVPDRDCRAAGTGLDSGGGTCRNGGCECDGPSDCQGDGLNVDQCVFLSSGAQCVCDDYVIGEEKAPCPLGLECVSGGCELDGTAYATAIDLYSALDIDAPPPSEPPPLPDAGPPATIDAGSDIDAGAAPDGG